MPMTEHAAASKASPFDPDNELLYREWRERKLEGYPQGLEELLVEVDDPRRLTPAEHDAILARCRKANMAVYAGNTGDDPDRAIAHAISKAFGVSRIDRNWLADDDGLTSLTVREHGIRREFIPYSNRPIQWHTDGYYNGLDYQIRTLNLHCVQPAARGGGNRLLDHEIAYLLLRDTDPEFIRALMAPNAMTIPARSATGGSTARPERTGPVFSIDPSTGDLHMRYTVRKYHVIWPDDPTTTAALAHLGRILDGEFGYVMEGRIESGMGLISNNVLHDRAGFLDEGDSKRLIYRARYHDRLAGTSVREVYPDLPA